MNKKQILLSLAVSLPLLTAPAMSVAAPASGGTKQVVQFQKNADSASYHGKIKGYQYRIYTFRAQKGQVLNANLVVARGNAEVVLYGFDNFQAGEDYILPESGEYQLRVVQPRAFARRNASSVYDLKISIRNQEHQHVQEHTENVSSQGIIKEVKFAKGASSATYYGKLQGTSYDQYNFYAKKGQILTTKVSGGHADAVLYGFDDFISNQAYRLPKTGHYQIRVVQPRTFARQNATSDYKLNIQILNK